MAFPSSSKPLIHSDPYTAKHAMRQPMLLIQMPAECCGSSAKSLERLREGSHTQTALQRVSVGFHNERRKEEASIAHQGNNRSRDLRTYKLEDEGQELIYIGGFFYVMSTVDTEWPRLRWECGCCGSWGGGEEALGED